MKLEIITPEKKVFTGEVKSVTLPGVLGLFTVLENHAPIISSLKEGRLNYTSVTGEEYTVTITGGFVEVSNNKMNVCVEGIKKLN